MSLGVPPSHAVKNAVRAAVAELGVSEAAIALGIGREATARIAAGFGVRRGTLALVERALEKRTK